MTGIERLAKSAPAAVLLLAAAASHAQTAGGASGAGSSSGGGSDAGDPTKVPAAASPGWGWAWYLPYPTVRATPNGTVTTIHPPLMGGGFMLVSPPGGAGTIAPAPPPGLIRPASGSRPAVKSPKVDLEKAELYLTFGDRLFRAGNLKRAEERFEQAVRANPFSAAPRLRLMQVAIVRGQYATAASLLREAETAEPGWIAAARDVQTLYGEPAAFRREIARLEEHLHSEPEDRDAWLVLGAELFLSRREGRAADVFRRLDDPRRKPDVALAAFLDAARLTRPAPGAASAPSRVTNPTPNPFLPSAP